MNEIKCYTVFTNRVVFTNSQHLFLVILITTLIPLVLGFNLLLITSLIKTRHLRKTSCYFIFFLAFSNLFLGLFTLPIHIPLFTFYKRNPSCILERIVHFFSYFNSHLSCYLTALIALERQYRSNANFTTKTFYGKLISTKVGSTISAATASCISIINAIIVSIEVEHKITIFFVFADVLVIGSIYGMYFRLYLKIWKRRRGNSVNVLRRSAEGIILASFSPRANYVFKLGTTVFVLLLATAVSYFPYVILVSIIVIDKFIIGASRYVEKMRYAFYISFMLGYANSLFQAVILLYRWRTLREFVLEKIRNVARRNAVQHIQQQSSDFQFNLDPTMAYLRGILP